MPRYGFTAYDGAGRLERGEIVAETPRAALDALARRGLFPLELGDSIEGANQIGSLWQRELFGPKALSVAAQATLARELATLLKAEIPVDEALRTVALQPRIGWATRQLLKAVEADVVAGAALSQALAARNGAVPEYFWRLVGAGEASGALAQVLTDLAGVLEQSLSLRKRLVTAILYPAVLLATAVLSITVIMMVMVPALLPLFLDAGAKPPFLLAVFADIERALVGNWPIGLAIALAASAVALWAVHSERMAAIRSRGELWLPIIGGLVQRGSTARICRTLSTLLRNGVSMLDALDTAAGVLRNRVYSSAIRRARDDVNRGRPLLASLTESGLFPPLALRLIGIGEQTGQLTAMLSRVADVYEQDLSQQLERLLALATPAITIFIGGLIGFLMVTVFGAIIGLNEAVLR